MVLTTDQRMLKSWIHGVDCVYGMGGGGAEAESVGVK